MKVHLPQNEKSSWSRIWKRVHWVRRLIHPLINLSEAVTTITRLNSSNGYTKKELNRVRIRRELICSPKRCNLAKCRPKITVRIIRRVIACTRAKTLTSISTMSRKVALLISNRWPNRSRFSKNFNWKTKKVPIRLPCKVIKMNN